MGNLPNPEFWRNKRVYITGAEGFKGKWLVHWLNSMGALLETSCPEIIDGETIIKTLEGFQPEIVIHMAAVSTVWEAFADPIHALETNAIGTMTLLTALKGLRSLKAVLNVTTDKVYHIEGMDRGYTELDSLGGLEPYAVSKVCSELVSIMYQKTYRLPLATARAGNVIGGGDTKESRIIPNYIDAYKNKTMLDVNTNAIRPWQYVLDALCGYLLLCEKLYDNSSYVGAWNFASNEYECRSVQWIVDEMNRYFEPKVPYRLIDARGYYETKSLKMCSEKATKALGWVPKYDMAETIRRTADWYKKDIEGLAPVHLYMDELFAYMGAI